MGTFRLKLFGSKRKRDCVCACVCSCVCARASERKNRKIKPQIGKKTKAPLWLNLLRRGIEIDHKQWCVCVHVCVHASVCAPACSDRCTTWKKIEFPLHLWKTRSSVCLCMCLFVHKCSGWVGVCVHNKHISVCISIHAAQCVWLDIYSVLQCVIKCGLKRRLYATLRPGLSNHNSTHR